MDPNKSRGPDGFNPGFYQAFWHVIGDDLFHACSMWLNEGSLPELAQLTNIILIPKVDVPEDMKDLRPISLCNVLYRVVAKVLVNRLRGVMPSLIALEQSAFIGGRSIIDNVLVEFESLHRMKRLQTTRCGGAQN
ncbi:Transposon TX1 uncharacterized 149 kDa protein [Linum perenne]